MYILLFILFIALALLLIYRFYPVLIPSLAKLKFGGFISDTIAGNKADKMNSNKIIFVLGKGGVGKSTYAQSLNPDVLISTDEIVRPWLDPNSSDDDYAFNVYRPGGNDFIKGLQIKLADEIRSRVKGTTAIEGALEDPELIRMVAKDFDYSIVYLRPASPNVFKKAMIKRVNEEYKAGELRLGRVWNRLTPEELDDYKANGSDGALFSKFMDDLAKEKYETIDSTLSLLSGLDYCVVNIDW